MIATLSIASHNRADISKKFLENLKKNTDLNSVEIIWSDNASEDETVDVVSSMGLPNLTILRYGVNIGFGLAHNQALQLAKGEHFIVINNDMFIYENEWLNKIIKELENADVVGVEGTPCSLKIDGNGFYGKGKEYIEGSFFAGKTSFFKKFGLFSEGIKKFFYEDSDASLRYRQMGKKLSWIPLKFSHQRGSTVNNLVDHRKNYIIHYNRTVLLNRWEKYLQSKKFSNKILVVMKSLGIGDVLCMTPALEALRKDHPTAHIEVETTFPEVFDNNPYVQNVSLPRRRYESGYDRIINIDPPYTSLNLIAESVEKICFTKIHDYSPRIFLQKKEVDSVLEQLFPEKNREDFFLVGINTLMERVEWQGRNWNIEQTRKLITYLRESLPENTLILELGKGVESSGLADFDLIGRTNLRELFSVMSLLNCFVGIDSLPFHIAQAFKIPSYILFGATEPISRVVDFNTTRIIQKKGLKCLGCYHKPGAKPFNKCNMESQYCLNGLTAEEVIEIVNEGEEENMEYLQKFIRRDEYLI